MISALSPAKVLLSAVHAALNADIGSLAALAKVYASTLHHQLLLRIILTYLPESVKPAEYVGLLTQTADGRLLNGDTVAVEDILVIDLTDDQAAKEARRLLLRPLSCFDAPETFRNDPLGRFLSLRARSMNHEAGMVGQLLDLLLPFVNHSTELHDWIVCTALPYIRRNSELRVGELPEYSLHQFESLPHRTASEYLVSQLNHLDRRQDGAVMIMRSILGPWLHDTARWEHALDVKEVQPTVLLCPVWHQICEWLLSLAASSWPVAVQILEGWNGLEDVEFGYGLSSKLPPSCYKYFKRSYAALTLACVYITPEATLECLTSLQRITAKVRSYLAYDEPCKSLEEMLSDLPDFSIENLSIFREGRIASCMKNDLLEQSNPLTDPQENATKLLLALILSAYILTIHGRPSSVKNVGELTFLRDELAQKTEVAKLLREIGSQTSPDGDANLLRARRCLLWLHDWGKTDTAGLYVSACGALGTVKKAYIETEFLKMLLSTRRYALARSLYEDDSYNYLSADIVQEVVYQSALLAFDNATNPDRSGGGLQHCHDIIHAFPGTVGPSLPGTKEIWALLKATYALSNYQLAIQPEEPFRPVVLRVHSDPISIIQKILEQNPRAYTRLQEFVEMGTNIARAGLPYPNVGMPADVQVTAEQPEATIEKIERRITAMCIKAALREDDFETAYSYVASRLACLVTDSSTHVLSDGWSWKAAMEAGLYVRTAWSQLPSHLGTASSDLNIRHVEQRIECLATALRLAPTNELQDILKNFRRCEEQLDSIMKEEIIGKIMCREGIHNNHSSGAFDDLQLEQQSSLSPLEESMVTRQMEDVPMSLFDLSRATARLAQKNITAFSSRQSIIEGARSASPDYSDALQQRVRKRDQLREAATGTLVSGVGWLIGARANHD